MGKMFVRYSGTKAAFIEAGYPALYTDKIVFIKGGENGTGACIYTNGNYYANIKEAVEALKFFSKISANGVTAEAAGNNGTINFTADDPASVEVKVDTKGVHFGLSDDFKNAVNTTLPNRIKAIEDDYLKASDKTELEGKVNTALADAKKYTDDEVSRIVSDSGSGLIGTAEDTSDKNTIYGAKKYAEEKAADAQSAAASDATSKANQALTDAKLYAEGLANNYDAKGAASTAEANAKAYTDSAVSTINTAANALASRVSDNEAAIATLNGEGDGSVKKQVADAIAGVVAGADLDFDTLKEVADWIASDTTGAAKMQADIAKLQGGDTIEGSVAKQVKDAVAAEAEIARAAEKQNADDIDAAEGRIKAIEDDYLKATDKTTLQNSINTKVDQSAYDTKMAALAKADSDNLASAKEYTNNEIAKLDVTDKAVAGQYVSAVSETDGKISVTRADLPTYTLATGSTNGTVTFNGTNVAVKGLGSAAYTASTNYATAALGTKADNAAPQATTYTKTEVDKMWEWEELN